MRHRLLLLLAAVLMLSVLGTRALADEESRQRVPSSSNGVPTVLILASYHDGDAWTDKLVRNLRYYLGLANADVRIRVHYLGARDLAPEQYFANFILYDSAYYLSRYDRVVVLDDPALGFYLQHASWFDDQAPIATGINDTELIGLARARGLPLALTSDAMAGSALFARQVTGHEGLLLLHSATDAGALLREQALQYVRDTGFASVTARTWQSLYNDGGEYTDHAVLALDAPLTLLRQETAPALAEHFEKKLGPIFCHADYLLDYGCDGGAFVNIAGLTELIARRLTSGENAGQPIEVPLELSLRHAWLEQLPKGIDVAVYDAPEASRLPLWGRILILALVALLFAGALLAWWRLHAKQQLVNRATRESEHDTLTRLYNRRKTLALIDERMAQEEAFCLLYLDLDGLKRINDTFGHAHGDKLLQSFAQRLRATVGPLGTYGRVGGDEFVVLHHQERPTALARTILQALETPFVIGKHQHTLDCAIGIALFPEHARSAVRLLKCADAAMYAATADPEERFLIYTQQMLNDQIRHSALSSELERALDNGGDGLQLHVQPIYSLQQSEIVGGEVLLRWRHPTEGDISPGTFVPIAEASDLILRLNAWVVERTFQRMAADQLHRVTGYLSINISAKQLYSRRFAQHVTALAERYRIPTGAISFEMTEHVRLLDVASVKAQIDELREAGFRVSLDDFGAGYTSISFLQNIRFSCVKIDRSLTAGLCGTSADTSRHIMQGLLYLGERLSQNVVVEGVETQAQSEILKEMGADHVQGFYYYRPMSWQAFVAQVSADQGVPR